MVRFSKARHTASVLVCVCVCGPAVEWAGQAAAVFDADGCMHAMAGLARLTLALPSLVVCAWFGQRPTAGRRWALSSTRLESTLVDQPSSSTSTAVHPTTIT